MRARACRTGSLLLATLVVTADPAAADACSRADFEQAVATASGALRDLNAKNRPLFQVKLRDLKEKRGWSHDQFMKEAEPLVRDAKIAALDAQSEAALARITSMGAEGGQAASPDCRLLGELEKSMEALVGAQREKWDYMFGRIDAELKR